MNSTTIDQLIESVTAEATSPPAIRDQLRAIQKIQSWLDAKKVTATRRLIELHRVDASIIPEVEYAQATHASPRDALRSATRVGIADAFPAIEKSLREGGATIEHVDVLAAVTQRLSTLQLESFARFGDELAELAAAQPPNTFRKSSAALLRRLTTPTDETELLEHQRRSAFLRHWIDSRTGMWCLQGEFDPETGARLEARIQASLERIFCTPSVDGSSIQDDFTSTVARQNHRRAQAFAANECESTRGGSSATVDQRTRPELVVVIDQQTLNSARHSKTRLSVNNGATLPVATVQRLACDATISPVIFNDDLPIDVGRRYRTATQKQINALRALYESCAGPDCDVRYDYCEPHHIDHWEYGGSTDVNNLLPLCLRHHRYLHEGGWKVSLDETRRAAFILPDGTEIVVPPKVPWAST